MFDKKAGELKHLSNP